MDITLKRFLQNEHGTLGHLILKGFPLCATLEDPWNNNARNISCIPPGEYQCVPHSGARYQNVWRLENVPGRQVILIHQGNSTNDTRGCILVGERHAPGQFWLTNSRATLSMLRVTLPQRFNLKIENP